MTEGTEITEKTHHGGTERTKTHGEETGDAAAPSATELVARRPRPALRLGVRSTDRKHSTNAARACDPSTSPPADRAQRGATSCRGPQASSLSPCVFVCSV